MTFGIIRICSLLPKYAVGSGSTGPWSFDLGERGMFVIVFALFFAFVKQYL